MSPVTWADLVDEATETGGLPVVIPTGSAPLAGVFHASMPNVVTFAYMMTSPVPHNRVLAALAACMTSRVQCGVDAE